MDTGDGKRIGAVERSVRILERMVDTEEGGVNQLARALDYSPSTVHAHLATLYDLGYLVTVDGEYAVSNRFLRVATHARDGIEGLDVIRANVRRLADETGESAQFMVEEHGRGIYVEKAEGDRGAPNDTSLGTPRYLHMCASGKAILAHLPPERVGEIVDRWGLPAETDRTITDEETLFAELDAIRDTGVATNEGETVDGLTAVGAPIRSTDGRVIGSISVSGPTHRLTSNGEIRERYRDELIGAVEDVTLNLTYL
ncbi:IclR family transcriptional regulator [Halorubrum salinum]|uniref:IclR family transcriptional regulator n=1 Tax=Halorubrum salinum TaxID=767517 RepID=UPI002112C6FF|nr:IclR family transcriptional regulator [Halorubrum salinum]